jgi:hypothetical protein
MWVLVCEGVGVWWGACRPSATTAQKLTLFDNQVCRKSHFFDDSVCCEQVGQEAFSLNPFYSWSRA